MVVTKNGPKLHQAKPGDTYPNGFKSPDDRTVGLITLGNGGPVKAQGVPLATLAHFLSSQLGRTVVDRTGLVGNYDFILRWVPDQSTPMFKREADVPDNDLHQLDSSGPSIFAALQEQLGLKLESQKGPVKILVIDHVEKPSDN